MQGKMRMKNAKTIPRVMPMMAVLSECEPCLGVEVEVALAEALMSVVREDIFFFFLSYKRRCVFSSVCLFWSC